MNQYGVTNHFMQYVQFAVLAGSFVLTFDLGMEFGKDNSSPVHQTISIMGLIIFIVVFALTCIP